MIRSIPMFSKFKFLTWYSQLSIIRYIQLDLQVVIMKVIPVVTLSMTGNLFLFILRRFPRR